MITRIVPLLFISALFGKKLAAQEFEPYMKKISEMMKHCSMKYESSVKSADSTFYTNGILVQDGNNYFDSSNIRIFLKNEKYMLLADHTAKTFSFLSLANFKKEFGYNVELNTSDFLLSKEQFYDYSTFKLEEDTAGFYLVSLGYKLKPNVEVQLSSLQVRFLKQQLIPIAYGGLIVYSSESTSDGFTRQSSTNMSSNQTIVRFKCYDLQYQFAASVFDIARFVSKDLKRPAARFSSYKFMPY